MADQDAPYHGLCTVPSTIQRLDGADTELAPARDEGGGDGGVGARDGRGDAASPLALASRGPRYEWIALLGEGGMGRVERLRDKDLLRDVAVKHVLPSLQRDEGLLAQFLWEARVTAYLDHPNVVPVHDLGFGARGQLYFTMKFVRGATLESKLEALRAGHEKELTRNRRLRLFGQICSAVAFAHARGVLHRDLKPANVLLGEFGEVLIGDWGLAIPLPGPEGDAVREAMPAGISTRSAGTPIYMSPEQARGERLDARSDIYTLGAILYELVTLERAVDAETMGAVLAKVARGEHRPAGQRGDGVSETLASVIEKAMALSPDDRYASADALARDVETVLDGRTPEADRAGVVKQLARYYLGRDPALSRMKVVDIDMWTLAASLLGAGIAALCSRLVAPFWWLLLVAAVAVAVPPTRRWLALRRSPDDEG